MKNASLVTVIIGIAMAIVQEARCTEYPHGLITPGHGIVTEDDLAYDAQQMEPTLYDPSKDLNLLHWQCFSQKEVKAGYKSWRGPDSMGRFDKIETMCTLEIQVRGHGELQIYADRRGHNIEFCRIFTQEWNRITQGESMVCLNGDGGSYQYDGKSGRYKLWTWSKVKTKRGCYSYFAGECNTRRCAQGKCPAS